MNEIVVDSENDFEIKRFKHFIGIDYKNHSNIVFHRYLSQIKTVLMHFIYDEIDYVYIGIINILLLLSICFKFKNRSLKDRTLTKYPRQILHEIELNRFPEIIIEKNTEKLYSFQNLIKG